MVMKIKSTPKINIGLNMKTIAEEKGIKKQISFVNYNYPESQ